MKSLGLEYHYLDEKIMAMAENHMSGDSICAFCARMKRGALYSCCRREGYNKLVLAQHLDDCVESFLMSTMYNGEFLFILVRAIRLTSCFVHHRLDANDEGQVRHRRR